MEAALVPRVTPLKVVMSMADVEAIQRDLSQVLTIVGDVREDVASLKTSMLNQDARTALFWSKDWNDLTTWRHDIDTRMGLVEKAENVSKGSIVTLKWAFASAIAVAGVVVGVIAALISVLH